MASFDVKSLFTNIPLNFTTNLIVKSLFHDGCTQFPGINQTQMKKLLKWFCQSTTFQFNDKFYKKIDGVAMGSPIAPLLADVMNHVIDQALTKINVQNKPIVLWRYVDDIFVVFNDMRVLDIFFNTLNCVHNNITFTKELECGDSPVFLDVLIEKTQSGIQKQRFGNLLILASTRIGQVSFHTTKNEIVCLDYLTGLIKSPAHIMPYTVKS